MYPYELRVSSDKLLALDELRETFDRHRVKAVYIFGSQCEEAVRYLSGEIPHLDEGSDLDVGVLFVEEGKQDFNRKGEIFLALTKFFAPFEIDLVVLNHADAYLICEATKGILLYDRDLEESSAGRTIILRMCLRCKEFLGFLDEIIKDLRVREPSVKDLAYFYLMLQGVVSSSFDLSKQALRFFSGKSAHKFVPCLRFLAEEGVISKETAERMVKVVGVLTNSSNYMDLEKASREVLPMSRDIVKLFGFFTDEIRAALENRKRGVSS